MDNIVYGKTEGIKKRVLEQLQSLYDLHLDQASSFRRNWPSFCVIFRNPLDAKSLSMWTAKE